MLLNIQMAVSEAIARDMWITRQAGPLWSRISLEPTNSTEGFIVHRSCPISSPGSLRRRALRWQPCAEDILANDWILIPKDYISGTFAQNVSCNGR